MSRLSTPPHPITALLALLLSSPHHQTNSAITLQFPPHTLTTCAPHAHQALTWRMPSPSSLLTRTPLLDAMEDVPPSLPLPLPLVAGVPYFVGDTFELFNTDASSLRAIEDEVERLNRSGLRQRCKHERVQRQWMMDTAAQYTGEQKATMQEQAGKFPLHWCNELDRYEDMERRI